MTFKNIACFFSAMLASCLTINAKTIVWFDGKHAVNYNRQAKVSPVVEIALDMFESDMKAVTGKKAVSKKGGVIEIIQLDMLNNKEFKKLQKLRLPIDDIITHKDAFQICCRNGRIIVVGSDGRGTAYGILELSRMAGVSPWIWWGDVKPERKKILTLNETFKTTQWPSVEYRGVFINDEDWTLREWAHERIDRQLPKGYIGPKTYKKIFQLLLRLRANTIWPGMHPGNPGTKPFFLVKGNKEMADSCSIVVGTSHCEPLLTSPASEWDETKQGPYNYLTNKRNVQTFWNNRLKETKDLEAIYTLGMRGVHDGAMQGVKTLEEKTQALQNAIDDQRNMLATTTGKKITDLPQVFVPYKEVLEIYENGLRIPNDVTLMWCDDNYGYLTHLPTAAEKTRKGGSGIYYHLSYWGRPHDYLWLATTQPGLICEEMRSAWDNGARRMWIVNVHEPKIAAYGLSLFLDMAWNINSAKPENVSIHLLRWLEQQFGTKAGETLLPAMREFYQLTGIRRPEFMGWSQVELDKKKYNRGLSPAGDTEFSATAFGNELEEYLSRYEWTKKRIDEAEKLIRPELKDAFFAAIKYPVYAAAAMANKHLQAQEARHIARPQTFHHDEEALYSAAQSIKAYREIEQLTAHFNSLANGKWSKMMCMNPRNLPVFDPPTLPDALSEEEIKSFSTPDDEQLSNEPYADPQATDFVAWNAADFNTASDDATVIDMLGHSMKAVKLMAGGQLSYQVRTRQFGEAILRVAVIPTHPGNQEDLRFTVSIDGDQPEVFSLKEPFRSERWKLNVLRGQAVREMNIWIGAGVHNIQIGALDNNIIVDQWMIDFEKKRPFYMFPIRKQHNR